MPQLQDHLLQTGVLVAPPITFGDLLVERFVERFVERYRESFLDAVAGKIFIRPHCAYDYSRLPGPLQTAAYSVRSTIAQEPVEHTAPFFYMYGPTLCIACIREFLDTQFNDEAHYLSWEWPSRLDPVRARTGAQPYDYICALCQDRTRDKTEKRIRFFRRSTAHWSCLREVFDPRHRLDEIIA